MSGVKEYIPVKQGLKLTSNYRYTIGNISKRIYSS